MLPRRGVRLTAPVERLRAARLARLRSEIEDEGVPLPVEGPAGPVLLAELLHARQPPVHEGRAPRYGSLVATGAPVALDGLADLGARIDLGAGDPSVARSLADGRGTFVVADADAGPTAVACFEHTWEHESSLVRLQQATGAIVVQRTASGPVRVCTPEGVVTWDGVQWRFKPAARAHEAPVRRLVPGVDTAVLGALLELAVHWLSAGRVGATLVWRLAAGHPPAGLDTGGALVIPALSTTCRAHYPALLSVLAQHDRAAVVSPEGVVDRLGVALRPSPEADAVVAPVGGTRHTSARRYSYDDAGAVVVVVSEDGPVSVFSDGAAATVVRTDPCRSGFPVTGLSDPDPAGERVVACPGCRRPLLADVVDIAGWAGAPERLSCPVCGATVELDVYRAAIRGVRKGG